MSHVRSHRRRAAGAAHERDFGLASTAFLRDARKTVTTSALARRIATLPETFGASSLATQFVVVGGVVSLFALLTVGAIVTSLIQRGVTQNAAATTALYVDSVIAPLLPDMRTTTVLDDVVRRALDETLGQGALGQRLVEMRLWSLDGTILYAQAEGLIGKAFPPSDSLLEARAGRIVANYERFDTLDGRPAPEGPLLEIYNPILQPWTGEVVAVIEFYERAHELEATLHNARLRSWAAVALVTILFFVLLGAIVFRGSRTIDRQARDLSARVAELTAMNSKVRRATQQATALNESYLRRLGADLHDGPAQFIALAAMRLESDLVLTATADPRRREAELQAIRARLTEALEEIRSICRGLVLPQIEASDLATSVRRAVEDYRKRTGSSVLVEVLAELPPTPLSQRICAYRFVQEALSNGHRHCRGARQTVSIDIVGDRLCIVVRDDGPGFDPAAVPPHSIGISGLRQRIESLGGTFLLETSPKGTVLTMSLDLNEPAAP